MHIHQPPLVQMRHSLFNWTAARISVRGPPASSAVADALPSFLTHARFLDRAFMTSSFLTTQFASEGGQTEKSATEQRNCRTAIRDRRRNTQPDLEREVLVRQSSPPRPCVGAGRHA